MDPWQRAMARFGRLLSNMAQLSCSTVGLGIAGLETKKQAVLDFYGLLLQKGVAARDGVSTEVLHHHASINLVKTAQWRVLGEVGLAQRQASPRTRRIGCCHRSRPNIGSTAGIPSALAVLLV